MTYFLKQWSSLREIIHSKPVVHVMKKRKLLLEKLAFFQSLFVLKQ